MANIVYNIARQQLVEAALDLAAADLWVMLVYGYVPEIENHKYIVDVNSYEVIGDGYSRVKLTGITLTKDTVNNRMTLDAADIMWGQANFQADGAILFVNTNDDTTSSLITYLDFDGVKRSQNTPFIIQWSDAEGILNLR